MCCGGVPSSNADDSFEKILEGIRQISPDPTKTEKLLTERILRSFIERCKKAGKVNEVGVNASWVYKKKRLNRKRPRKEITTSLIQFVQSLSEKKLRTSNKITIRERPEQDLELEAEPTMPEKFKRIINGMNGMKTMLVIEKELEKTDVAKRQNRLSIPEKRVQNCNFINEEEMKILDEKKEIKVNVVTPSMEIVELKLKKWKMRSGHTFNLIGGWIKEVVNVEANELQSGTWVRLWSFRQNSKLCFILDNVGC